VGRRCSGPPAGAEPWHAVPNRQTVQTGDRVRTGAGAAARLVYFEGTMTELGPDTGVLVQRLERGTSGNIIAYLYQAAGTTVSRVMHLLDPAAAFEIETPAVQVFVRGTTPRVDVAPQDGTTRVRNVPDGTASRVGVIGKDANRTLVILLPGEETEAAPGRPPSPPTRWNVPTPTPTTAPRPAASTTGFVPPRIGSDPCQWPGANCDWLPPDPCSRPSAVCDSRPTDPCQRPNVICDPVRPDPCRQAATACDGGTGPGPSQPRPTATPTRVPRPSGNGPQVPSVPTRVIVPDRPLPSVPVQPTRTPAPSIN
jgi:hypothetical protein